MRGLIITAIVLGMMFDAFTNIIGFIASWGYSVADGITAFAVFQLFFSIAVGFIFAVISFYASRTMEGTNGFATLITILVIVVSFVTSFVACCEFAATGSVRYAGMSIVSMDMASIFSLGFLKISMAIVMALLFTLCTPSLISVTDDWGRQDEREREREQRRRVKEMEANGW